MADKKTDFIRFPRWLIAMPEFGLSHTAKLVYMLILARAREAVAAGYIRDSKPFCYYTSAELARSLGTSRSSVKRALGELRRIRIITDMQLHPRGPSMHFLNILHDYEDVLPDAPGSGRKRSDPVCDMRRLIGCGKEDACGVGFPGRYC